MLEGGGEWRSGSTNSDGTSFYRFANMLAENIEPTTAAGIVSGMASPFHPSSDTTDVRRAARTEV